MVKIVYRDLSGASNMANKGRDRVTSQNFVIQNSLCSQSESECLLVLRPMTHS